MAEAPIDFPLALYGGVDKRIVFRIADETLAPDDYAAQIRRARVGGQAATDPLLEATITQGADSHEIVVTFDGDGIRDLPATAVWDLKEKPIDEGPVWATGTVTVRQAVTR